jgi:diacylglycerol kinase (ATP)
LNKNGSLMGSFKNAFSGLFYFFRVERNARIHLVISILVILISFWVKLSIFEWIAIGIAICLVWAAELFNTSLEKLFDLIEPNQNIDVKIGKDTAAAAVLIAAMLSILIGMLILGPALIRRLF